MLENRKNRTRDYWIVFGVLVAVYGLICIMTGMYPWSDRANVYNSYSLQARAWREGRLDLGQDYSYLELAIYGGKYFVSFPPFPSFLFYFLGWIFGEISLDSFVALASTTICAVYVMKILYKLGREHVPFWTLYLMVGSNLVFVSVNGWVWFIAQNLCFTLSIMAIYYAMEAEGGTSLFCWACSVGCRPFQVVYLPLLVWIIYKKHKEECPNDTIFTLVKKRWYWAFPTLAVAMVYMWLNYVRFGNIMEFGHNYLPEFTESELGQFHISYITTNWWSLVRLAEYNGESFSYCKFNGMAIWISMPIFLSYVWYLIYYIRKGKCKDYGLVALQVGLMILHGLLILSHKTLGGWQFGNRYFIDLLPFAFYTFLKVTPAKGDRLYNYQRYLFIFGGIVNLLGTIVTYNEWV